MKNKLLTITLAALSIVLAGSCEKSDDITPDNGSEQVLPKDVLSGVFSVSDTKKVHFSKGNLFYDGSKYCFENNQYDIPVRKGIETSSHNGHFFWSSKENCARELYIYSDPSTSGSDVFFANRPESFEVNGQKGWSVLSGGTGGEWEYLLDKRKTTYGKGTAIENRRYAAVQVNSVAGLLVFPDEFSWPEGAGDQPQTFNTNSSSWNDRNYTVSQFGTLQAADCVFLPAAGLRNGYLGSHEPKKVNGAGIEGYYWSASPCVIDACDLNFSRGEVDSSDSYDRHHAFSVRLVMDVK